MLNGNRSARYPEQNGDGRICQDNLVEKGNAHHLPGNVAACAQPGKPFLISHFIRRRGRIVHPSLCSLCQGLDRPAIIGLTTWQSCISCGEIARFLTNCSYTSWAERIPTKAMSSTSLSRIFWAALCTSCATAIGLNNWLSFRASWESNSRT